MGARGSEREAGVRAVVVSKRAKGTGRLLGRAASGLLQDGAGGADNMLLRARSPARARRRTTSGLTTGQGKKCLVKFPARLPSWEPSTPA